MYLQQEGWEASVEDVSLLVMALSISMTGGDMSSIELRLIQSLASPTVTRSPKSVSRGSNQGSHFTVADASDDDASSVGKSPLSGGNKLLHKGASHRDRRMRRLRHRRAVG